MDDALIAAVLSARVAEVNVRLEGMKAENLERLRIGAALAYGENAFLALIEEVGVHHNAIHTTIQELRG